MRAILIGGVLALMTVSAWAQSGSTPLQPPGLTPQARRVEPVASEDKSPAFAVGLSLTLTAAGLTTLLVTDDLARPDEYGRRLRDEYRAPLYLTGAALLLVGPTAGHIYAGKTWNRGLGLRILTAGVGLLATKAFIDNLDTHDGGGDRTTASVAGVVAIGALIGYVGASCYEIGTAGRAARRFNERKAVRLAVAPLIAREPGIAVMGRF